MSDETPIFQPIGAVAESLGLAAHVLRFWETKFPALRPVKRGGGRRFYRASDVALLRALKHLLHGEQRSIAAVQTMLARDGAARIASRYGKPDVADPGAAVPDDIRATLTDMRDQLQSALNS